MPESSTVIYASKGGKDKKTFDTLEWLVRARPPPKIHAPPATAYSTDNLFPYSPPDAQFYGDPDYSWDDYH